MQPLPNIDRSRSLALRAQGLIPCKTQTLAKGPTQWSEGIAPRFLERGRGARVWDVDGNEYLDLVMGVGPVILGYCSPKVDDAIRRQLDRGITFSLPSPLEVEVAERVRELVPGAERVRFSKTGADVVSAAVRLARAATGRDRVLCCGYHGWHDWYVGVLERHGGVPSAVRELVHTFEYNDLDSVRAGLDETVACVVLEPTIFEPPAKGFLEGLRALCDERGALLVFDEMWTGFRLAVGGAQQHYGIHADLACFSKAVANGMPLSVLTGRAELMDRLERDVFFFTTFGGEALSLAAAKATLDEIATRDVPRALAQSGARLREELESIVADIGLSGRVRVVGYDARTALVLDDLRAPELAQRTLVQQEMLRRGVLWSGQHNLSLSHGPREISAIVAAYREVLPILAEALEQGNVSGRLEGGLLEPSVRRTTRFNARPRPLQPAVSLRSEAAR
jgi:glutamate-1-semialdehyde 2,1-aminomutase